MSDVLYLYGFVPVDATPPPPDIGGVANAPVRLLDIGGVRAAVADVPGALLGPDIIEARLDDLAWIGAQGMAHERVVLWFVDHAEILPARLLSIYSGAAALRAAVASRADEIARDLERRAGRREWNLKVAYDAAEIARHGSELSDELRNADREIADAAPGRRYLLQRKRADIVKHEVTKVARRLAHELLDTLRTHAEDVRVLPLAAGDETGTVVLNAALLVHRDSAPRLREDAARLHDHYTRLGMIVSFSGPWAPYRFMEHDDES